jgi:hypothetical protein
VASWASAQLCWELPGRTLAAASPPAAARDGEEGADAGGAEEAKEEAEEQDGAPPRRRVYQRRDITPTGIVGCCLDWESPTCLRAAALSDIVEQV